jgi:hypothetical protein
MDAADGHGHFRGGDGLQSTTRPLVTVHFWGQRSEGRSRQGSSSFLSAPTIPVGLRSPEAAAPSHHLGGKSPMAEKKFVVLRRKYGTDGRPSLRRLRPVRSRRVPWMY